MSYKRKFTGPRIGPDRAIREATKESINDFIRDTLVESRKGIVSSTVLYQAYLDWYDALVEQMPTINELGYQRHFDQPIWDRMTQTAFGIAMGQRFVKRRKTAGSFYVGVVLKP